MVDRAAAPNGSEYEEAGKSGGSCVCAAESGPTKAPAAPLPDATELTIAFAPGPVIPAVDRAPTPWIGRTVEAGRPLLSHNEKQALLGVWRT